MRSRVQLLRALGVIIWLVVVTSYSAAGQQLPATVAGHTQIVLLGTGTPRADPQRSGPATAVVVNGTPYLVDAGPGIVRRAAAAYDKGVKGLAVANLQTAFITHLHSDHTVGYPDLIFTTWVQGRSRPLKVYGPPGIEAMTKYIMLAWQVDIEVRTKGLEQRDATGLAVEAHDVKPGLIYQDSSVKVTAFPVSHGELLAYGYRFQTSEKLPAFNLQIAVDSTDDIVMHAWIVVCEGAQGVFVEGDSSATIMVPATAPGLVSVAGLDYQGRPWARSSRGPSVFYQNPPPRAPWAPSMAHRADLGSLGRNGTSISSPRACADTANVIRDPNRLKNCGTILDLLCESYGLQPTPPPPWNPRTGYAAVTK